MRITIIAQDEGVTDVVVVPFAVRVKFEHEHESPKAVPLEGRGLVFDAPRLSRLTLSLTPLASPEDGATAYTRLTSPPAEWPTPEMIEAFREAAMIVTRTPSGDEAIRRGLLAALGALHG